MGFSAPQRGTQSRSGGPKIGPPPSGNPIGQSSSAVPLQFATIMTPSPGPCSSHRWNTDDVLRFVDVRHVHVLTAEPAGVPAPVETEGDRVAIEADQAMELLLQAPVQRNAVADELPHFVAPAGREPPQRVLGAAVVSEARCPSCRSPASRRTARGQVAGAEHEPQGPQEAGRPARPEGTRPRASERQKGFRLTSRGTCRRSERPRPGTRGPLRQAARR